MSTVAVAASPARPLAGTWVLFRLALRRDRVQIPLWVFGITLTAVAGAASILGLYDTQEKLTAFAQSSAHSAIALALNGLISGDSEGAVTASQTLLMMAVTGAFMSAQIVVRHTRQNEELGRGELVMSGPVGRHAFLTAALLAALTANIALALVLTATMLALGLPADGAFAFGVAIGAVGCAFAGVAAIAAQLSRTARGASAIAGMVLAVAFALRAAGDMVGDIDASGVRIDPGFASWLSPVGWGQLVRPWDTNDWWLLALLAAFTAATVATAFVLTSRRDHGQAMIADRPGSPTAAAWMVSPRGLALRLQRGAFIGWALSLVAMGLLFGAVAADVDDLVGADTSTADLIGDLGGGAGDFTRAFLAMTLSMSGIGAAAAAIYFISRLRAEEVGGTMEETLVASVSRTRWMLSHLIPAVIAVVAIMALVGAMTALGYGIRTGETGLAGEYTVAALVRVPAALAIAGVSVLAFGFAPKLFTAISWGWFTVAMLLGQLGELLRLPEGVLRLSPFTHVPVAPVEPVDAGPLIGMTISALIMFGVGIWGFRRRDISP